jgi:hypothetical protein
LAQIWPELGVKFHTLNFGPNFNQYGLMCRLKRTRVSKGEVSFSFFFCVLVYNCRLDENETIEVCKIKIHSKYTRLLKKKTKGCAMPVVFKSGLSKFQILGFGQVIGSAGSIFIFKKIQNDVFLVKN